MTTPSAFDELTTRVQRRVIDVTASVTAEIPDLINEAIRKAEDHHNYRVMEAVLAGTTTDQTRLLVALPTNWKEFRANPYLRDGNNGELGTTLIRWASSREDALTDYPLDANTSATGGRPTLLLINDMNDDDNSAGDIHTYPLPDTNSLWTDGNYRVEIPYWKYLTDLTGAQSNWFTRNGTEYVLAQATASAFWLNWDEERATTWETIALAKRKLMEKVDKRSRMGRSTTLTPRRDVYASKRQRRM